MLMSNLKIQIMLKNHPRQTTLTRSIMVLFLIVFITSCCPCYYQATFDNVKEIRTKTLILVDDSANEYSEYKEEIKSVEKMIDDAIANNNSRRGCKEVGSIWRQLKSDDSDGVYDRFITEWEKSNTLNEIFREGIKGQINSILDQLQEAEELIKEKKKKC